METFIGTTEADVEAQKTMTKAQLEASIKEFESAKNLPSPPESQVQEPPIAPPPVPPTEPTKAEPVQQDNVKEAKEPEPKAQVPEHQKPRITQEELIKQNKALRDKIRVQGEQLKAAASQPPAETPAPVFELPKGRLTPEAKKVLMESLDKDPTETLDWMIENRVNQKMARIEPIEQQLAQERQMKELDILAQEGHDWIHSEGLGRFDAVFKERPYLMQSPTPYADAVRFLPNPQGQQPAQAHVGPKTPILGANRAVPPPSNVQPVSVDQETENMNMELEAIARIRDPLARREAVAKYEVKMDEAARQGKIRR